MYAMFDEILENTTLQHWLNQKKPFVFEQVAFNLPSLWCEEGSMSMMVLQTNIVKLCLSYYYYMSMGIRPGRPHQTHFIRVDSQVHSLVRVISAHNKYYYVLPQPTKVTCFLKYFLHISS